MKGLYFLLIVSSCSSLCYPQEAATSDGVFNSYEAYLKTVRNLSLHSDFKDRIAEKSDVFTHSLSERWKIDFQGKRLWRTARARTENPKTGEGGRQGSGYNESLVTSSALDQISVVRDKAGVIGFSSYLNVPKDYWSRFVGLGYLCYPFGYLQDGVEYRYIPDIVRQGSRNILARPGLPASLVTLACETGEYKVTIRLDSSKGWMADEIEFKRTLPTKEGGRVDYSLYTVKHSRNHGGVWLPDLYDCKVSQSAGQQKLPGNVRMVDGKIVIMAGRAKLGTDVIEKPRATLIAEVSLSDMDLLPLHDSDFRLQTEIPNGTRVSMQDAPHLQFEWEGGRIVPVTAETLDALRRSRFLGGPRSRRFWLVGNVLIVFALLLYVLLRRWRKARVRTL